LGVDVMVLDLQLQDGSGVHVCRQVRAADPSVHGLLLTSADDDQAMAASVLAGAAGFVVKLARSTDIVAAIRRVGAGRTLMDNALRSRTADVLRQRALDLTPRPSARDLQILDRILDGRTDQQLADELGLDLDETQTTSAALADRLLDHA
jgi:two-component system response regulator DevR